LKPPLHLQVGRSHAELLELDESIQETLRSGDGEVEYWEAVLALLAVSVCLFNRGGLGSRCRS
jgi:hypothetical protein